MARSGKIVELVDRVLGVAEPFDNHACGDDCRQRGCRQQHFPATRAHLVPVDTKLLRQCFPPRIYLVPKPDNT